MEKKIKIALFSPATPPSLKAYQRGIKILKKNKISFKPFIDFSDTLPSFKALLLYELITSGEYDFIWSVRGGFGSIKLIPYLEEIFSENKKINIYSFLIGFSDVTALHLYFYKKFNKAGLHAPMVVNLPELSEKALRNLLEVIFENKDITLEGKAYKEGIAEGVLLGGNLITMASLCGTPYFYPGTPFILAIEDTKEKKYRLERAFLQIIFTVGIEKIKGIVVGNLGGVNSLEFLEGIESFLSETIPVGYDFSFGHIKENFPFIIGQKAYLTVKNDKAFLFQKNIGFKNL